MKKLVMLFSENLGVAVHGVREKIHAKQWGLTRNSSTEQCDGMSHVQHGTPRLCVVK